MGCVTERPERKPYTMTQPLVQVSGESFLDERGVNFVHIVFVREWGGN